MTQKEETVFFNQKNKDLITDGVIKSLQNTLDIVLACTEPPERVREIVARQKARIQQDLEFLEKHQWN